MATSKKILAIDDQKDNLTTIRAVLKGKFKDCTILTALSGREGIEIAKKEQPDIILLDIIMPQMDGYQVCTMLKSEELTRHIPILLITAIKTDTASRVKGLDLGADAFLSKPIDAIELTAQVNVMLRIKEAEDKLRAEKEELEVLVENRTIELKESNEKYMALYENAPLPYQSLNEDGSFVDVNPAWLSTLGYKNEEVIGKYYIDFLHPDYKPHFEKNFPAFKKRGYIHNVQFKIRHKNGHYLDISFEGCIGYHPDGSFRQTYCVFHDITERKRAEEKLVVSEERFKTVAESAEEWVWEVDNEGLYTYSSPMVEKILGYKPEELVGEKRFYDFFQDDIREQYKAEAFRVFDQKLDIKNFENANVHKNGQIVILITNGSPILDKKGNLIGFRGVDTNITQIKQNEEALLYEKYLLHTLMDNSPDYIYFKDINSCFIRINTAQSRLFGLSNPQEAVGKKDSDFFTEDHSRDAYNDEQKIISTGQPVVNKEEMETLKNGEISWANSTKLPLRDSFGKIIGTFGISRDITEQKKIEQELIDALKRATESDRLKSAFLANMSHEIRTPMNGILGFTSLLKEHNLSGEQHYEYIDIIQKSGTRMLNTVNDIIEIARIEAGEMKINSDTLNVNNHLIDLFDFFVPEAEKKGLKLIIDKLPEEQLVIATDKNKFSSIVTNLIKNAIKFTEEGIIKIGCKKDEKFIEFYIEDTGIGIPENRKDAIFNRFEQADIGDTRVYEGSGLGLAIVKYYVEMLGGKIWVDSEENRGSTFFFTIAYQLFNTENEKKTVSNKKQIEMNKKVNILVVEDDETSFLYLSTILKDFAENIQLVKNGLEAVKLCENDPDFDIVLMDIKLPVMDGLEATKKIREFNKEIKIIAQTAYALEGDKAKAIEVGCNDYISKPINREKLIDMINKHL